MSTIINGNEYILIIKRTELSHLINAGKWNAYKQNMMCRKQQGKTVTIKRI